MPLRAIGLLFFLTGATGLVYQTTWMRMLSRVFGVTVWATTVDVAVFMGGLALGALLASRRANNASVRSWGYLELGVAGTALLATGALQLMPELWGRLDLDGAALVVSRVVAVALCLLPSTTLMGATLPVLVRAARQDARALGLLYGVNTLGAVCGAIAVGFLLIVTLGERGTVLAAAAVNVAAGGIAVLRGGQRERQEEGTADAAADLPELPDGGGAVLRAPMVVAALVGLVMLALEIAWTRLLIFVVGSSVYAFTTMVAAFLAGLGVGGLVAARRPSVSAGGLVMALATLAGLVLLSARTYAVLGFARLDDKYNYSPLQSPSDLFDFAFVAVTVIAPATFVSGLLLPWLVTAAGNARGGATGQVFGANTAGAVVGALLGGFVLVPIFGPSGVVYLCGVSLLVVAGGYALLAGAVLSRPAAIGLAVGIAGLAVAPVSDVTGDIVAARIAPSGERVLLHDEGIDTTVTVSTRDGRTGRSLYLNGVVTSTATDASLVMGHVPLAMQERPTSALVICLGVGGTFLAATQQVDEVHAVELSAGVVEAFPLFWPNQVETLRARNNRVFVDDGRNFLLRSRRSYDAIVIDGPPPMYAAGATNLYTIEMLQLANERLSDQGVFLLWLPTHTWYDDVWVVLRAVLDVFPHVGAFGSPGSGILVVAARHPLDVEGIPRRMRERAGGRLSTEEAERLVGVMAKYLRYVDGDALRAAAASYRPLTDDLPTTENALRHLLLGTPVVLHGNEFLEPPGNRSDH